LLLSVTTTPTCLIYTLSLHDALPISSTLVLITGIAFGLFPALRATRFDLALDLKENSRNGSGRRSLLSKGLLVVQVSMSLVLLIDRKSTRLNSSHQIISYAVLCLKT